MTKTGVIILSYKSIDDTVECIKSFQQVRSKYTTIIPYLIDNSETDEYINEIKKHVEVDKIFSAPNNGYSAGNNVGIKAAMDDGCDYILVINNDTLVEKDFIDPLIETLESSDNIALVAPIIYRYCDKQVWSSGGIYRPFLCDFAMSYDLKAEDSDEQFLSGCCFMGKSRLFKTIGLLDEEYFMYSEDAEFSYRILKSGMKNRVVVKSKIYHKVSASSGVDSPFQLYYLYRNRIIFAREEYNGIIRKYAILINELKAFYRMINRIVKKDFSGCRALCFAIIDSRSRRGRYRY